MKGITAFMLEVLLLLFALSLLFIFLDPMRVFASGKPSTSTPPMFSTSTTTFDYSTYLLDSNPVDIDQYDNYNTDLCKKLKNALKYAVMTGRPYKVDEIAYGSDLISSVLFPFIGNCNDEVLETEIVNGLKQKVCNFKQIAINSPVGRNDYGGIPDTSGLSFDGCFYKTVSYSSLFGHDVEFEEDLNHAPDIVNLFYSPDYLYIKNGDYSHHSVPPFVYQPLVYITNATAFDNAYNGAGRLKIYVGDAQSKNGDCTFNIYFCPRPAIAKSIENSTISIFNLFKDFELASLKYEFRPYYITDLSNSASAMRTTILFPHLGFSTVDFSKKVYYWNYYDVELDGDYDVTTILNAIKEGLYLNINEKKWFFAQPHWDISRDISVDKGRECWSSSYDSIINSASSSDRSRSIRFNCGDDNICKGKLRIKIAIRLDNVTTNIDSSDNLNDLDYVSGFISFCDEGSVAQYCGNNVKDGAGTEQCDCGATSSCTDEGGGDTGGATCTSEKYQSGELQCTASCKFDYSKCVPYVCGDGVKNGFEDCDGYDFGNPPATCGPASCPDKCQGDKRYTVGNASGTLKCTSSCKFDNSDCSACTYRFVDECTFGCKDSKDCNPGLLGTCTIVYNDKSEKDQGYYCMNAWGAANCVGNICSCNSGSYVDVFNAYMWNKDKGWPTCVCLPPFSNCCWPWAIGNGYGYVEGCWGTYGSLRAAGGWMNVTTSDSKTWDYSSINWGASSCDSSGCKCTVGTVATAFESYVYNNFRGDKGYGHQEVCLASGTSGGERTIGYCTQYYDPQSFKLDYCLAWGDAYCSGSLCSCSKGSIKLVFYDVFAWDAADKDWTYSWLYYCTV